MTVTIENLCIKRAGNILYDFPGICLFPGAFLLITGANGSGKSSFLKRMAGIIRPNNTYDRIRIDGVDASDSADRIAYIGHRPGLVPEYSVEQYLRYYSAPDNDGSSIEAAIRCFGLERFRHTPCAELSAGWQQRTALASLMSAPKPVWLLDEPSVFLDQKGMVFLCRAIAARCYNHGIVIATTNAHPDSFKHEQCTPTILNLHDISPQMKDIT